VSLAGVVLAAGAGTRLRPLTDLRPKALCPVATVPLLDHALSRLDPLVEAVAVNAHHLSGQVVAHVGAPAHVSVEVGEALGTAGALGALRPWLDGREVLVTNADAYLPAGLGSFVEGWDGDRSRLLCASVEAPGDFPSVRPGLRYVGACLLGSSAVCRLRPEPSGLYEVLWRDQLPGLDLVTLEDVGLPPVAFDCGTVAEYLAANLYASGGASVIDPASVVEGTVQRCVVWDGAYVAPDEQLADAVRAGSRIAPVTARPS
jgi:N-acetyl-alpha-D-muramate 1-phosphate uridylyltransferase